MVALCEEAREGEGGVGMILHKQDAQGLGGRWMAMKALALQHAFC